MADDKRSRGDDVPTLVEVASSPAYDRAASQVAKSYIFLFFIFCGVIAYLDEPNLGWWWLAIIAVGTFASSILFAFPATFFKLFLGTRNLITPFSSGGIFVLLTIDLVGYVAMWFPTRYAIGLVATMFVVTTPAVSGQLNKLEELYLDRLQAWIDTDGSPQSVQESVLQPCSKVVMITADEKLAASFLRKENMDEYDFRASFCMKATVHQKFPQPEFKNADLIKKTCAQPIRFFRIVCEKYGLYL